MKPHPKVFEGVVPVGLADPWYRILGRRICVQSIYLVLTILVTLTAPIWLPLAAIIDLVRRGNWMTLRITTFFWVYFLFEIGAIVWMFAQWLFSGIWLGINQRRFLLWNFYLQRVWVINILAVLFWVFDAKVEIHGDGDLRRNKFIIFMRHSSMADTIMGPYLAYLQFISLRIIIKRGVLYDPAIEMTFNRNPNVFVDRGGSDSRRQINAVGALMDDFGPGEGIVMYPEGTRYTEEKKKRILDKFAARGNQKAYDRAKALRRSLPPRPGGPLRLLEENKDADVLFLSHVGLENSTSFREMWNGGLIGKTIKFKFWRVPFDEIPKTREEREEWLYQEWLNKVDAFVVEELGVPDEDAEPSSAEA